MPGDKSFKIAVLISGTGTTLRNLIECRRQQRLQADIVLVGSSNPKAGGLEFATAAGIPTYVVPTREFPDIEEFSRRIFEPCRKQAVDLVVLAGFLRKLKIPADFQQRVINIHPSLIPAFAGPGYYGLRVHSAVIQAGCKVSGCTVHFVDDHYDHGAIIEQAAIRVEASDTPESLAARVFSLECQVYPQIINQLAAARTL